MAEIICPLCGKPNPPELDECQYCQAPLKTGGFLPPSEGELESEQTIPVSESGAEAEEQPPAKEPTSDLEQAIPDWLKQTEANFLDRAEELPGETTLDELSAQIDSQKETPTPQPPSRENAIDDEWLAGLLADAGVAQLDEITTPGKPPEEEAAAYQQGSEAEPDEFAEEEQPAQAGERPDWLANLEASSTIKLEGGMHGAEISQEGGAVAEQAPEEEEIPEPDVQPDWLSRAKQEEPPEPSQPVETPGEGEEQLAAAELPTWLEALRPGEATSPTGPVEDLSGAEVIKTGPLAGLRGVISAHPSAYRAQKPPSFSIKLRVTDEQQARMQMMQELLANEDKPKPLPVQHVITTQNVFRLIVAVALLLPVIWMVVTRSQQTSTPQPGNIPGVVDFTQRIQMLPSGAPVLMAFDYEAGFTGEMNLPVGNVITQLMNKNAYLAIVSTISAGPALAETAIESASASLPGTQGIYQSYANLGYLPGGTMGLLGLVKSPRSVLPYSLDGTNVWAGAPLDSISGVEGFSLVIVATNDPDTARIWIEQVGPKLQGTGVPLLIVTSAQAEPLIRPYFESNPAQVQGMIAGLAGGVAYARTIGNIQSDGTWDALSAGITVSVVIIIVGSIAGVIMKMPPTKQGMEK